MEKQVCQADPRSWRVAGPGCGEGRSETRPSNCGSLLKRLVSSVGAAEQSGRCCGSNSRNLSDVPCAPKSDAPSFYCRDSQTFLALVEHRCELRLEIKLRCSGQLAEALQIHGATILLCLGKEVFDMFIVWVWFF